MSEPPANERLSTREPSGLVADGVGRVSFAGFVFDPVREELLRDGTTIALTPKALALLRYFLSHEGRVLSKDELIRAVWGSVVVTDDSLVQCVRDLRTALGDREQKLIKTLPRRGYMLDVRPVPAPAAKPAHEASSEGASAKDPAPQRPKPRLWRWTAIGTLMIATVFVAGLAWNHFDAPPVNIDEEIQNRRALAVLAFTDARGKALSSTLGNDLPDAIGTYLVRNGVKVIARAATMHHDPATPEFERIGREQGVKFVIGGLVNREHETIRVDTYLTEIATGAVYRLHEVEFSRDDEARHSNFGQEVAIALRARFYDIETARAKLARRESDPLDAIALAWRDLDQGSTQADIANAERRFKLATQADPASTEASMGLGAAYLAEFYSFFSPSPLQTLKQAESEIKRTLDLAPDNPQSISAWAEILLLRQQPDSAIWLWQRALALNPDYQVARLRLAHGLIRQGRYEEAQQHLSRITDLRPYLMRRQQALNQALCDLAFAQGRDQDAYDILMRWAAEFPNSGRPYLMMAAIDSLNFRDSAAAAHMARHLQLLPNSNAQYLALTYPSNSPAFLANRARLIDGARKAGLPEGAK